MIVRVARRYRMCSCRFVGALLVASLAAAAPAAAVSSIIDFVDPTYGGQVRQLFTSDANEHNLYHYRTVWNADNSYMVSIRANPDETNWRVVLYDGDGVYVKDLFPISQYDWRLVWDRHDPKVLYTWKGSNLYRFNVETGAAELMKSFAPLSVNANGPTLNQAGDRILIITSDKVFHSYRLPGMTEERAFSVTFPPGTNSGWDKERYIGYTNYIVTSYSSGDGTVKGMRIYDDSGNLYHECDGQNHGHTDFSPDGQWAYFKLPTGGHGQPKTPLEIHVVNIDGSDDRLLYSVPGAEASYVHGLHITWPDNVSEWFVVGFFPASDVLPAQYAPPLDEIMIMYTNGSYEFLARTGTTSNTLLKPFWTQPLPSPSGDGTRIAFDSDSSGGPPPLGCTPSGTIDQFIVYTGKSPQRSPGLVVKAASGEELAVFDAEGNLMLAGTVFESAAPAAEPGSQLLVRNQGGAVAATVDVGGNLRLAGTVHQNQSLLTPPPQSLRIKNISGNVVAYITSTGDVYLLGEARSGALPAPRARSGQ